MEQEYEYNERTSMTSDGNDYTTMTRIYRYDNKDRVISIVTEEGDIIEEYVYDEFGNITKEKEAEYIYEYDDKGNWTKKTTKKEGEIYCIEERNFVY